MIATAKRNPDKWGKVTVVAHIPILFEEEARKAKPDHFFDLPWHFIEEYKNRERNFSCRLEDVYFRHNISL